MFGDNHTLQVAQACTQSVPFTGYVKVDVAAAV
jgi:hypothetical protein